MPARFDLIQASWARVSDRYPAYGLVLPGEPSFVCQAESCPAHCCLVFSVSLGERELERMRRVSGLEVVDIVECDDGVPLTLPMAQPYLLRRSEGRCAFLDDGLRCGQYGGRPEACRLYPHQLVFVETDSGRPVHGDPERMQGAISWAAGRRQGADPDVIPLLLRHLNCPGFTGPPTSEGEWQETLIRSHALQFPSGALSRD